MSSPEPRRGAGFWIAFGVGWVVIVFAIVNLISSNKGVDGAIQLGAWIAAGHALHDLVLAPAIFLIGLGVARVARKEWRAPIHFGFTASAAAVLVAYPALRGFGRNPANRSIQPLNYTSAVLTVLAVVWTLAFIWMASRSVRAHRHRNPASPGVQ